MCHSIGLNLTCTNVSSATNDDRLAALYEYTYVNMQEAKLEE